MADFNTIHPDIHKNPTQPENKRIEVTTTTKL